ncbi:DUF6624 domain-containing protein [Streptomyces brevispora]|uniref:DUF6624 domain-containing protein n=1 Tax=Streptomyces brevispora TaxID=887462 RepID=UPI003814B169
MNAVATETTTTSPLRQDVARELIARAKQSAVRRQRRLRNEIENVQLGQDRHADHADSKVLRRILVEHEWPGHRLVGPEAARAAWSLALHADDEPDFQRAATTLLERAVRDGDALVQHWAHLHDRALVNGGHLQEYGTQLVFTKSDVELCALRAPESVDRRRAAVGLPPIAVALETVRRRCGLAGYESDPPTAALTLARPTHAKEGDRGRDDVHQ